VLSDLPQGKERGEWQRILLDEFGDHPRWSAIIRCPECGTRLPIPNHTIAADGHVRPSVGHPKGSCPWHPPSVMLLGWAPCPPNPSPRPFCDPCIRCGARARQLAGWGMASGGLHCPICMKIICGIEVKK
jgi:DNA-directed RNA polymerase subunit RPC12/RpoP